MRRLILILPLLAGCRFDSLVAIHYHAQPGDERVIYRYPPASQPAATQPADEESILDILKGAMP